MSAYSDTSRNGGANNAARIPFVELVAPFHFIADGLIAGINYAVDVTHKASTEAAKRRQARRTTDRLRRLDNHMLRDIGINRSEITRIGFEASNSDDDVWQHPGRAGKQRLLCASTREHGRAAIGTRARPYSVEWRHRFGGGAPVATAGPMFPNQTRDGITMTMEIASAFAPSGRAREDNRDEMATKTRILVVDDEADIRETLDDYLKIHDFEVTVADGGEAVRQIIEDGVEIDVVLLDINMPGEDGLSLARFLREHADVGIIMLTAVGETVDRIVGLEMGADDYLVKPVDLRELLARIRAVTRRLQAEADAEPAADDGTAEIVFGRCRLNLDSRKLFDAERNEIPITSMEFDLLKAFADHPNRVLNRDQLLDLAHNRDWEPFDRSIDIRIARIRRKLEVDPSKPEVIKTVRGAGYIYVPPGR